MTDKEILDWCESRGAGLNIEGRGGGFGVSGGTPDHLQTDLYWSGKTLREAIENAVRHHENRTDLICNHCGEFGDVFTWVGEITGFHVERVVDGKMCCRSGRCETEEGAIEQWKWMHEDIESD